MLGFEERERVGAGIDEGKDRARGVRGGRVERRELGKNTPEVGRGHKLERFYEPIKNKKDTQ